MLIINLFPLIFYLSNWHKFLYLFIHSMTLLDNVLRQIVLTFTKKTPKFPALTPNFRCLHLKFNIYPLISMYIPKIWAWKLWVLTPIFLVWYRKLGCEHRNPRYLHRRFRVTLKIPVFTPKFSVLHQKHRCSRPNFRYYNENFDDHT